MPLGAAGHERHRAGLAADDALQAAMAYRGRCSRASHKTDRPVNCAADDDNVMNIMSYPEIRGNYGARGRVTR
jgi:hypothetical protein